MVPNRDGGANHGHACVKGRFAYGYATHADRVRQPMIRAKITDPWREVSWDEALTHAAAEFRRVQAAPRPRQHRRHHLLPLHQRGDLPGAEAGARRLRQQQRRHLRARVPFAHRLRPQEHAGRVRRHAEFRFGAAGRRRAADRRQPDRGAPGVRGDAEAPPARGRAAHRRRPARDPDGAHAAHRGRTPPAAAARHQRRGDERAGPRDRDRGTRAQGLRGRAAANRSPTGSGANSSPSAENSPEATGVGHRRAGGRACARPRVSTPVARNGAIYYGLGVTEHSQGTTAVMAIANLAMATGNLGREGVGVNPLRGQNNVQGSCDMGSFPHELAGYRHISDPALRALFERRLEGRAAGHAGPAHPEHVRGGARRQLQGPVRAGRGHRPVRPEHAARHRGAQRDGMRRRAGPVPERDRALRARVPARLVASSRRTAPSPMPSAASAACAR